MQTFAAPDTKRQAARAAQQARENRARAQEPAPQAESEALAIGTARHELGSLGVPRAASSRPFLLQRKCACGAVAGPAEECSACRKKRSTELQTKLQVSEPGDAYEQEADGVADRVMRMTILNERDLNATSPSAPLVQRRVSADGSHRAEAPLIVDEVLRSPGQPLDSATRAFFEPRFGHDFSRVRVHTDAKAAQSAQAVNADAYTFGQNVVFGQGRYSPTTAAGQRLIAHELTHVVQQSGESRATIRRRVRPENVSCQRTGLTNPDLTGDEAVAVIAAADADAIALAQGAEDALTRNLADVRAGGEVDPDFDTILQEELGLTLANPAHFRLIEQQANRFRRVRETLESGYLRYICRGGTVSLVGCAAGTCGEDFAFSCPGNRLIVLCQAFWDNPDQQSATILHEPFHIWFDMARHATNALRRADASCFESFALRVAGRDAFASCVDHTAG